MKNELTEKQIKKLAKAVNDDKDLRTFLMGVIFELTKTDDPQKALNKMLSVYTMGVIQGMGYTQQEAGEALLKEGDKS